MNNDTYSLEPDAIQVTVSDVMVLVAPQNAHVEEAEARAMQDRLIAAADETPKVPVVLDLSKVQFMPSRSLSILVALMEKFKRDHRRFILVGVHRRIRETLTMCRLIKIFEIHSTLAKARAEIENTR